MILKYKGLLFEDEEVNCNLPVDLEKIQEFCEWEVIDDNIFISSKKLLDDQCKAVWFSKLLFLENDHLNTVNIDGRYFKFKLYLKIERGQIIEKQLIYADEDDIFKFKSKNSLYSNRDILYGRGFYNFRLIIENILRGKFDVNDLLLFKSNSNDLLIKLVEKFEKIRTIYFFNNTAPYGVNRFDLFNDITNIVVNNNFIFFYLGYNEDEIMNFMNLLEEFINDEILFLNNVNNRWVNINPDFEYIKYAINNIEWFTIDPVYFRQEIEIIDRISTCRKHDYIFNLEFSEKKIKLKEHFSNIEIEKNSIKIMNKYGIKYDADLNNYFLTNYKKNSFVDYLLSESSDFNLTEYLFTLKQIENADNYVPEDDHFDHKNWLIDAAGSNDPDTMSDVFWNID